MDEIPMETCPVSCQRTLGSPPDQLATRGGHGSPTPELLNSPTPVQPAGGEWWAPSWPWHSQAGGFGAREFRRTLLCCGAAFCFKPTSWEKRGVRGQTVLQSLLFGLQIILLISGWQNKSQVTKVAKLYGPVCCLPIYFSGHI